jgi:hypothetical protein
MIRRVKTRVNGAKLSCFASIDSGLHRERSRFYRRGVVELVLLIKLKLLPFRGNIVLLGAVLTAGVGADVIASDVGAESSTSLPNSYLASSSVIS